LPTSRLGLFWLGLSLGVALAPHRQKFPPPNDSLLVGIKTPGSGSQITLPHIDQPAVDSWNYQTVI